MARGGDSDSSSRDIRMAPHNLEAEKAVLGTLLLVESAFTDVQGILSVDDFHDLRHRAIYTAIEALVGLGRPLDVLSIHDELDRQGMLDRAGGLAYISGLEQSVISPGNVRHHAEIVREKSMLRQLIRVAGEVSDEAYTEAEDSQNLLKSTQDKLFNLLSGRVQNEFRSIGEEAVQNIYRDVIRRSESRHETTGITTGIKVVDDLTGGLHPSDLIILAARPSVGKTSFALNIAVSAANHCRVNERGEQYNPAVGIFSLEMSFEQVIQRIVCTQAQIPMDLIRKNTISRSQIEDFKQELEQMALLPIYVNDTPGMDPTELRLQAQRLKSRDSRLSLIIIDYMQLMSVKHGRVESRQQEVSQISRMLKALARDLDVPVVALSQLSRNIESRRGKDQTPRLSDLRESGSIEQDADVVMFLHRLWRNEPQAGEKIQGPRMSIVDLVVAKQRNGPIGTCHLAFREDITRYEKLEGDIADFIKPGR
jgi:replicative DNA helicase